MGVAGLGAVLSRIDVTHPPWQKSGGTSPPRSWSPGPTTTTTTRPRAGSPCCCCCCLPRFHLSWSSAAAAAAAAAWGPRASRSPPGSSVSMPVTHPPPLRLMMASSCPGARTSTARRPLGSRRAWRWPAGPRAAAGARRRPRRGGSWWASAAAAAGGRDHHPLRPSLRLGMMGLWRGRVAAAVGGALRMPRRLASVCAY